MLLTLELLLMCVCAPLNYLTSERNGAIEMQDNNNNNSFAEGVRESSRHAIPNEAIAYDLVCRYFSCAQLFAVAHRSVT